MTPQPSAQRLVNLGCGTRYHADWINIDIVAHGPGVIAHDLSKGIPLAEGSCDAVYHSNVIEHIRRAEAPGFLRECRRVLKPGGMIRVGTPDLERICELYLEKLRAARRGDAPAAPDYDWMLLEMYDQTVREKSGGTMLDFLRQKPLANQPFVFQRIGQEGRELVENPGAPPSPSPPTLKRIIRRPRLIFELLGDRILRWFWDADAPAALRIGRFRLGGEVHQWMYDRYSLAKLLREAGFENPAPREPAESKIPGWERYHLDTLPTGETIKPDSFFIEARKPA